MLTKLLVVIGVLLPSLAAAHPEPTIVIQGNHVLTTDVVRDELLTDQPTLLEPSGAISQEAVERASLLLSSIYWEHGYAQVRVDEPKVDRAKHRVELTIKEEGPQFTIGTVRVTGTLLRSERSFLAMIAIKPGKLFSRATIANDREKLQRFYEDRAYAYANVLPLTKLDVAKKTIALTFEITQNELAFIEKVSVVGNTKTSTQDILDQVSIKVGDPFHATRLDVARERLRRSGQFSEVWMVTKKGSSDSAIEIIVEVDQ